MILHILEQSSEMSSPLSFKSSNVYQYDSKSFLFSLNNFEKYPKNSYLDTKSLWCYEDYGPSFHYDLYFLKGKIYIINFYKSNYLTPNNWVNKDQCYKDNNGVILDSLEIFQIFEENYNFDELPIDNNINFINHINNNFNINNIKKDSKKIQKQNNNEKEKENIQKSKDLQIDLSEIKANKSKFIYNLNDVNDEMFDNDKKSDNKSFIDLFDNYD